MNTGICLLAKNEPNKFLIQFEMHNKLILGKNYLPIYFQNYFFSGYIIKKLSLYNDQK